jgi:hypothetical protein
MKYTPDNYGYYTYKNFKTYNKYDIMTIADSRIGIKWNYNDDFFSSYDWTKEPVETLSELYKNRAIQLRNDYDYVILMYSGGSDSSNILETFIKNNIYLDEICHLTDSSGSDSFLNKEIFITAKPKVEKYILELNLKTLHRKIDITDMIKDFFNEKNKFDFIHTCNSFGAPNMHIKHNMYKKIPLWDELIDAGKKIAVIWGCEKPHIKFDLSKKNFAFHFMDIIDGNINLFHQNENFRGIVDELFYWAPIDECAKIIIKQSHVLKEKIVKLSETGSNENTLKHIMERSLNYGGYHLKYYIYPYYNPSDYNNEKSLTGNFLSSRDKWFWKNTNERNVNIFLNGVEYMKKTIDPKWIENTINFNGKTFPKEIAKINSKLYHLQ